MKTGFITPSQAAVWLSFSWSASSLPTVSFPINSQLPPVARPGQLFAFSFSPYTFRSDDSSNITYTLGQHPDWLSLDSGKSLLSGTPSEAQIPEGDVVGQQVEIVATDDTGSTTLNATLVVARHDGPEVQTPVAAQVSKLGNSSAPSTLLSYPSSPFRFSFSPDTFTRQAGLTYYAASENHSPLPAWIDFEPATLTFSGETPGFESLVQPPQSFHLELIASDVVGFSAASVSFSIVVGRHNLTTSHPVITLNATRNSELTYRGVENSILLDGKRVQPGEIEATAKDLPSWLSFDPHTWDIRGTPGEEDHSSNFTIQFRDSLSDDLAVLAVINVGSNLFKSTLQDLRFTAGQEMEIDLTKYLKSPADAIVEVSTEPEQDWIRVKGLQISGTVPENPEQSLTITVRVSSKSSAAEQDSDSFQISFDDPGKAATATAVSTAAHSHARGTSTGSSEATKTPGTQETASSAKKGNTSSILLATLIPILAVCLVIMLLVCICRRRKSRKGNYLTSKYRSQISRPVNENLHATDSEATIGRHEKTQYGFTNELPRGFPDKPVFTQPLYLSSSNSGSSTTANSSPRRYYHGLMVAGGAAPAPKDLAHDAAKHARDSSQSHSDSQSWFTVDGTSSGSQNAQSERSRSLSEPCRKAKSQSQHSDVTLPEGQQPVLPIPSFSEGDKAFRDGLRLAFPDRSSIQPTPDVAYGAHKRRERAMSSTTCSSEALPPGGQGSQRSSPWIQRGNETIREDESMDTRREADARAAVGLPPPLPARLSSQPRLPRRAGSDGRRTSMLTESSFGSTENWRLVGGSQVASPSHGTLDEELELPPRKINARVASLKGGSSQAGEASRTGMSESSEGSFRVFL